MKPIYITLNLLPLLLSSILYSDDLAIDDGNVVTYTRKYCCTANYDVYFGSYGYSFRPYQDNWVADGQAIKMNIKSKRMESIYFYAFSLDSKNNLRVYSSGERIKNYQWLNKTLSVKDKNLTYYLIVKPGKNKELTKLSEKSNQTIDEKGITVLKRYTTDKEPLNNWGAFYGKWFTLRTE